MDIKKHFAVLSSVAVAGLILLSSTTSVKAASIGASDFAKKGYYSIEEEAKRKGGNIPFEKKNISWVKTNGKAGIYDTKTDYDNNDISEEVEVISLGDLLDIPSSYYIYEPVVKHNGETLVMTSVDNKYNTKNLKTRTYLNLAKTDETFIFSYYINDKTGEFLQRPTIVNYEGDINNVDLDQFKKNITDYELVTSDVNKNVEGDNIVIVNRYNTTVHEYGSNLTRAKNALKVERRNQADLQDKLNAARKGYSGQLTGFAWGGEKNIDNVDWKLDELVIYGQGELNGRRVVVEQAINIEDPVAPEPEPEPEPEPTPTPDKKYTYKVIYKDEDGKVLDSENITVKENTKVTHKPKTIKGYTPTNSTAKTETINKDNMEIIFVYKKDKKPSSSGGGSSSKKEYYNYTVEYIYDGKVLEKEEFKVKEDTLVEHNPKKIKGYIAKDNTKVIKRITNDGIVIKFYYDKDNEGDVQYDIIYKDGDKVIDEDRKYGDDGEKVTHKPKDIQGYTPVSTNSKSIVLDSSKDNVIIFQYKSKLNKDDHFAYIQGYEDKTVRPENKVSRAEVAEVFYRLLEKDYKNSIKTSSNGFGDVVGSKWYNYSISTLANAGIINGYEDNTFKPNQPITRAELATIASKFDKLTNAKSNFKDTKGHWAEDYIGSASKKGWVKGYEDNTFKPNQAITRAEFVTLVNNVLERNTKQENMLTGRKEFRDLKSNKWYYEAMQEAINSHEYVKENGIERWTSLRSETLID